ncbi:hypothetical protein H2198_000527 [Neophaeococcomyces mojaviensis]|uniref:Uncharacterized protein n=1 Tax=Neophaeococcomyces mojaviensis TaxID=3383035 RepID=A0ACC3AKB3_9EURO|nr:hypothetical protein H2198_000527 [Knufia sp. JES_112]
MSDDERRQPESSTKTADTDTQEQDGPVSEDRKRSRSRSRGRGERRPRRKDAGFKWKEKRGDDDDVLDDRRKNRDEGLRRGYRDQYVPRSRSRSRSPRRYDSYKGGRSREDDRYRPRDRDRDRGRDHDRDRKRDFRHSDRDIKYDGEDRPKRDKREEKKTKNPATPQPAVPQQEMILVTVNDRLGTKKQIPCLPSDTVKDFKAVVAMMIGRRPHEILLKRQSERPFKDFLTLQDYGVGNNVQLDLEVDTGD